MAFSDGAPRVVAGRYVLGRLLGRGGMGSVWLAHDRVLGRDVAVKEVTFPLTVSEQERTDLRERTLREARAAARFEHPRVTTVHDVVEEDGRPWIVMEHVPSRSLSEVLEDNGPLPEHRVARIGLDLLEALTAAHRAGIVHRDVKPANVLVDDTGRAWLTDFGIATSSGDSSLTGIGVLLGSPPYMAPERGRGEEPGPAADLWSLGATLYAAVQGAPPFERAEAMATLMAVATEPAPAPTRASRLEPVLRGLLVKDPRQRMTAGEAAAGLEAALVASPAPARVPGDAGRSARAEGTRVLTTSAQPSAPPSAPPAQPPQPAAAAARPRGADDVLRLDRSQLRVLAKAATRAVAGSAAREVSRRVSRDPAQPRRAPAGAGRAPAPHHPGAPPARARRRFKRRWVVAPVLLVTLAAFALIAVAGLVLGAVGLD